MKLRTRKPKESEKEEEPKAPITTTRKVVRRNIRKTKAKRRVTKKKTKSKRQPNKIYTFARMQRIYKVFFEINVMGKQMSRAERADLLKSLGDTESRRLTYRLQNHKKRCEKEAKAYKRLFEEGLVHNYESFLTFLFNNNVPELEEVANTAGSPVPDAPVPDAEQQQQE